MTDTINKKVISIFNKSKIAPESPESDMVKYFKGFNYVRFDKDLNGRPFNEEHLVEYSEKCEYIIRVMREKSTHVALYNYKVPHDKLIEFISKFANNELNGKIIEIDKYIAETLA
ncbi:MAG: hypothetical protein PHV37_01360 [Candidatus Gastranaerophilales bacterium]|nr:hypothetical protein [Candidatus Gastranaerophilales bacterium]